MELKKVFEKPEIEVIKFSMQDVITTSGEGGTSSTSFKTNGVYNFNDLKVS